MITQETLNKCVAIGKTIKYTTKAVCEGNVPNDIIDVLPFIPEWEPGHHIAGSVVKQNDYPYRCNEPGHDSTGNPAWSPISNPALWSPYHATDKAHALPYIAPTCAADVYNKGEWMIWSDGLRYRAKRDAIDRGPDILPNDWEAEV